MGKMKSKYYLNSSDDSQRHIHINLYQLYQDSFNISTNRLEL